MYLTSAAARELRPAFAAGEPLITDVDAVFDLTGIRSFDDFTSPMAKKRRYRIARELRDFEDSSFRLREGRLSEWSEVAGRLLSEHHRRFGHEDTPEMLVDHFGRQAAHLDELSHVLVCEQAGVPVGFVLSYEWDGAWYVRAAGAADGLRGASAAFFNLVYYAPIRAALERGIRRYDVGPSSLQAKLLRGAQLEPRWSLVGGYPDLDRGARWNDAQLLRWDAELAGMHVPSAGSWRRELQISR
jgi:predicted N-acyltransferase